MDKVLETVLSKLDYIPTKDILVKPLEDVYVEKEIIKPVDTGKKDSDGYNINDTETVKEKVLATFKMSSTIFGAKPNDGSSRIKSFGIPTIALATATICCSPPDRVPAVCLALSFNLGNHL